MNDEDSKRRARAADRRKHMKIRFTTLGDESDPWPVRGPEAISLAAMLSRQAWSFTGRPFPKYSRSEMPLRFTKRESE